MDLITRRRLLMARVKSSEGQLPVEYQEVEYLGSNGTQYLITTHRPIRYDEVDCGFSLSILNTRDRCTLFSAGNIDPQFIFMVAYATSGTAAVKGAYYKYFASGAAENFNFYPTINEYYDLHIDQNGLASCNGYTAQSNYVGEVNTDLYLMRRANNSTPFYGKLYYFKITNSGEVKLHLIPCYRKSDNKPGMYDRVSRQFFINKGNGDFLVGPDIN